jgi:hypothetical protein
VPTYPWSSYRVQFFYPASSQPLVFGGYLVLNSYLDRCFPSMDAAGGGAATFLADDSAVNQETKQTTDSVCQRCCMPFRARLNSQNLEFCTRNCAKQAKLAKSDQTQKAATTATTETRQMVTRQNSLTVLSQPSTPLPTASVQNGHKRERALTPTSSPSLPGPSFKKGTDEMSILLSTLSQVSLSSLNKSDLIDNLKSCMSHMLEIYNSVYLDRISELESTVETLKTELVDSKLAFADKVISNFK